MSCKMHYTFSGVGRRVVARRPAHLRATDRLMMTHGPVHFSFWTPAVRRSFGSFSSGGSTSSSTHGKAWQEYDRQKAEDFSTAGRKSAPYFAAAAAAVCTSALLGGGTVCASEGVVPYHPDKEARYGESYSGRVLGMRELIDPRLLLTTERELRDALSLLSTWSAKKTYNDEENNAFWEAKKIVKSMVHPVTQEVMFMPGRMSAFVPVNTPTAVGMLLHGPTSPAAAAFWQFANQTGNAITNYVNRSGATVDTNQLAASFASACSVSVLVALGMGRLVARTPMLRSLGLFVPYVSVCMASAANLFLTRQQEWREGVPVTDEDGNYLGKSAKAGFQGVYQTVTTRGFVTPLPILVLPPLLIMGLRNFVASRALLLTAEISTIIGCMYYFLPFTLALQPQKMTLNPKDLEPEFHDLRDKKTGQPITAVYANKGL